MHFYLSAAKRLEHRSVDQSNMSQISRLESQRLRLGSVLEMQAQLASVTTEAQVRACLQPVVALHKDAVVLEASSSQRFRDQARRELEALDATFDDMSRTLHQSRMERCRLVVGPLFELAVERLVAGGDEGLEQAFKVKLAFALQVVAAFSAHGFFLDT